MPLTMHSVGSSSEAMSSSLMIILETMACTSPLSSSNISASVATEIESYTLE